MDPLIIHGKVEYMPDSPIENRTWFCVLCGEEKTPYMADKGWMCCVDCWTDGNHGCGGTAPGPALTVYGEDNAHWRVLAGEEKSRVSLILG